MIYDKMDNFVPDIQYYAVVSIYNGLIDDIILTESIESAKHHQKIWKDQKRNNYRKCNYVDIVKAKLIRKQ